jgi:arylsulfatase A-like enzyme
MPARPNLVFVFADQLRAEAVGCYGNEQVQTPTIDGLAADGIRLDHAYSSNPICGPARGCIMTGKYSHANGMVDNYIRLPERNRTVGECFRDAGYTTGYIGKWHLDGEQKKYVPPERRGGFEWWRGFEGGHEHLTGHPIPHEDGSVEWIEGYQPAVQTDLAIEFVEEYGDDKAPFCLFVSWGPPHSPYEAPDEYSDRYDAADLELRPNVPDEMADEVRADLREYYAMTTSLDDNLGRLLDALDDAGVADETAVCVSADHGEMMGSHGNYGKDVPFEESIHIPFVCRYPDGIGAGRTSEAVVSLVDYMPTFLSLCDIEIPEAVQGRDFADHLLDASVDGPDATFLEGNLLRDNPWRAIRTAQYCYVVDRTITPQCLFDTDADPYQQTNVLDDEEYADVQADLHDRLIDALYEYEDRFALPHHLMSFGTDRWMSGAFDDSKLGVEK